MLFNNQYSETKKMLNIIRENESTNKKLLTEENNSIAITDDPKFGVKVLTSQIDSFLSEVDNGAKFGEQNENNPNNNPLVYMSDTNNLVFSGSIPSLNNLKFQYSLNDSDGVGCFIWCEGLRMTEQNMTTLRKLYGYYLNWRDQWRKEGKFLEKLK